MTGLWLLLLLTPVARGLDPQRALDHYGHQVWRTDSGLPQNTVHAVLQTGDGFLWLGTEGGLVRFDGVDFVTYNTENTPQLPSDTINDLLEDAQGGLWVSTAAGLVRYRGGIFTAYTGEQGLPSGGVWCTYQDHARRLWAMTAGGPAWFDGQRFTLVAGAQAAVPLERKAVAEDDQGRIWLGSDNGLFALATAGGAPRLAAHLLPGVEVQAVLFDRRSLARPVVWIGSTDGLARWENGVLAPVSLAGWPAKIAVSALYAGPGGLYAGTAAGVVNLAANGAVHALGQKSSQGSSQGLGATHVDHFYQDRQGSLWLGSEQGGFRLRGGQIESFASGSELAAHRVLAMYEDREGNLWWGTEAGGLHLLRDQKFTTYTTRDGLSGNFVRSVFQSADGTVWIGTDGAGLNRRTPAGFDHYTTADGLSSNVILSLADGGRGAVWVGTPDGLNLLRPAGSRQKTQVKRYTSADGLPDDFIRSLYADPDGSLWIGTRHGLARLADGKFTLFSALDGLGSDFIGVIFRGPGTPGHALQDLHAAGDLWIGTSGGLTRLRAGGFTNFPVPQDPAHNTVTAIARGPGDSLWLGTNGGGLESFRDGFAPAFPDRARELPSTIYAILKDGSGRLWLSAPTGIYRVAVSGAASPSVTAYGAADGMNIRECSGGGHPAAWKLSDGSLWFATLDGVSFLDPAHTPANQVPPPVVIERVLVDDRPQPMDQELTMPPGANRLELQYAGLSYQAPQKVQYRYRLEGFDKRWIEAGARRAAFYTNLPPGHYRFRVLAANNDGVWNETGAALALRMLPHYYQTYWFYAALLLAVVALGSFGYRWRVRQVEAQFGAVLAERGRLAREIHDTLAQGFVGISVQLEVLARLLAGGAASGPAIEQLDQARALVRESLAEARTSIWDLRSANAATEDLPARLNRTCNRMVSGSATRVYLQVKGTCRPVAGRIEDELLRIGQEAVTNAVRHAEATRIDVQLIYEAARMLLVVADDGRGFAPLPGDRGPEGHYGIQGMYERAQQIGGRIELESTPGAGTRISIEVALREAGEPRRKKEEV